MAIQAQKVSQYASWGRLIISQSKTIATAALYKRQPQKPFDKDLVCRLTRIIEMQGHVITAHDPKEPYKMLGVWYTMDLQWKKQQEEVCKALKSMAAQIPQKKIPQKKTKKNGSPLRRVLQHASTEAAHAAELSEG